MFAYCNNNPINYTDPKGECKNTFSYYLKADCGSTTCPTSSSYVAKSATVAVIYDGRQSGLFWGYIGGEGFAHQGSELINRLSERFTVEAYSFASMQEFVDSWNKLDSNYYKIYIVAHGNAGGLHCDGKSIGPEYADYSYSFDDLVPVSVTNIQLYCCNGATANTRGDSVASMMSTLTGASVTGVENGSVNFSWNGCYPSPVEGGNWITVPAY